MFERMQLTLLYMFVYSYIYSNKCLIVQMAQL